MTNRQLVGVLRHVGLGHGVQRLFAGERIDIALAGVVSSGWGGQAAGPGRDGAAGIAGFFRTDWGQVLTQPGYFSSVQLGQGTAAYQAQEAAENGGRKQILMHDLASSS